MKTGIFAAALLQLAAAMPHHGHMHHHEKKAAIPGHGMTYTPYTTAGCKSATEMQADVARMAAYGIKKIRTYDTDCDQVRIVHQATKAHGMRYFPTTLDFSNVAGQMNEIAAGVGGDWSNVYAVGVGNEVINQGLASVAQVGQSVGLARSTLRGHGFNGSVVAPEVFDQFENNPELCQYSDWIAANGHAFFDNTCKGAEAGSRVRGYYESVSQVCGGKVVRITESGWPKRGEPNGKAIPSLEAHNKAIGSLKGAFHDIPGHLYLFSAFDDMYKSPGDFGCEQYWGVL